MRPFGDSMSPAAAAEAAKAPQLQIGSLFVQRMRIAVYAVILFVLAIHLLKEFREMLQPLFVALFLSFLMQPIHRWLVRRGMPSLFAYGTILIGVLLGLFVFGIIMYYNVTELAADKGKLKPYGDRLENIVQNITSHFQKPAPDDKKIEAPDAEKKVGPPAPSWREVLSPERFIAPAAAVFSQVQASTTWAALTLLYIFFLVAEKVSFPRRLVLAFGTAQGERVLTIVESINQAIGQYIAVKTLVSALAGLLSYGVLASFNVELAASWSILIFLLNYIPYVGSLVACAMPILLSFLKFGVSWEPFIITGLLIGIQQVIGNVVEPRMAGQRLDVSPLLIVLSLAFWWSIWGVFGAILAVPLLVIVKIILDNIPETKPIATLISNR